MADWGADVPLASGGYLSNAEFRQMMDSTFGAGRWRETGGWRSQARENQLRAQGAGTVRPGAVSAHTYGNAETPGGRDIVVNGMTPDAASKMLRQRGWGIESTLAEGGQGGQGAHVHVAMARGGGGGPDVGWGADAPVAAVGWGADAPIANRTGGAKRALMSGVSGLVEGAGKAIKGFGEAADAAVRRGLAMEAESGGIVSPDMGGMVVLSEPERQKRREEVAARQPVVAAKTGPTGSALIKAGEEMGPVARSPFESFIHGAGEFGGPAAAGFVPVVGLPVAAAGFAGQGFEQTQREAIAAGKTPAEAEEAGLQSAMLQGGIGMLPAGEIAKMAIPAVKAGASALARIGTRAARIGAVAGGEGALNTGIQIGENVVARQYYDPNRKWTDQLPEAFGIGAAVGGALQTGGEGIGAVTKRLRPAEAPVIVDEAGNVVRGEDGAISTKPAVDISTMPETDAISAYTGRQSETTVEVNGVDRPDIAARVPQAKRPVPEAGASVLFKDDAGRLNFGRIAGLTDDGTPIVETPLGDIHVPPERLNVLPGDYEAARVAQGAPLEQMPQAIEDFSEWRKAAPKDYTLYQAIKDLGGIRTRNPDGTPNDVGEVIREGRRYPPGTVNNQTGLSPDVMREALQEKGWFGAAPREGDVGPRRGDDLNEMLDLLRQHAQGEKPVRHPFEADVEALGRRGELDDQMQRAGVSRETPATEAAAKLAAWRADEVRGRSIEVDALRQRAEDLGITVGKDATADEILGDVLEREAIVDEATAAEVDTYERNVDALLTIEEHEWLSAPERGPRGVEGETFGSEDAADAASLARQEEGGGEPGEEPGGDREDAPEAGGQDEPLAAPSERQDIGGEVVEQNIIPGAAQSAAQAAQASGERVRAEMPLRSKAPLRAKVEQQEAGPLFSSEADLFAHPPRDIASTPEAKEAQAKAERPAHVYGADNKVFTKEAADAALEVLRRKFRNQLNAGLDPELVMAGMTRAGYHIEAGARAFADYAARMLDDLGEGARPYLKMWYNAARDYPGFGDRGMTAADEITPQMIKEARGVLGGGPDLERGGEGTAPADGNGPEPVPAGPGQAQRGPGGAGVGPAAEGRGEQGGGGLPDRGAAPVGEGGAGGLQPGAPGDRGGTAGGGEPGGSDVARDEGVQPDRIPATDLATAADDAAHLEPVAANAHPDAEAVNAPPVPRELEEALPTLFPEQRADVVFAEQRFEARDKKTGELLGHGVMFTNGTGTGKTFTGGGVAKRFYDRGKRNILILAPSQGILNHWQEAFEKLGMPFSVLEDTKSAGKGPVGTTYANLTANDGLAGRDWDLVIADEAHTLSSDMNGSETQALTNFRAITHHPDRLYRKAEMLNPEEVAKVKAERESLGKEAFGPRYDAWAAKAQALHAKLTEQANRLRNQPRTKAVFLSATPFAYDKSIDYASGYLFDYGPEPARQGYNEGSARDQFMMRHFGYRMRYGKLTKPEAGVESDIMERQFHEWLRRTGALSGRVLNVDKDYDRKFVLVAGGVGQKIDDVFEAINADERWRPLGEALRKRFDYLSRVRLLEAIKAKSFIPIIKAHHRLGRKVVVFHNYNEGGGFAPFEAPAGTYVEKGGFQHKPLEALYREFAAAHPEVEEINAEARGLPSPIEQLQAAFPDALVYNGTVPKGQREKAKQAFNQDGGKNLIIVQSEAGQAGISLHDTTGQHQRVLINLGLPGRPVAAIQQEGRIYRIGQASDAMFRYGNTGTGWERQAFATTIAQRAGTAENLALGEQSRALRQSFIDAFLDSAPFPPAKGEGRGGKAADREVAQAVSEFQKAKSLYFAEAKKTARTKAREGDDYFATPEPLGLKMVEWADIKPGDKVLEPSAGHGAIARFFPETADRTLVEPSSELATRAELHAPGADVRQERFEDLHVGANKFDAIVMNPPFGHAGATAIAHLKKAMSHLRDGGRIVALLPRGATDAKYDTLMESHEAKGIYEVGVVDLPPVTFERAGTKVRARIVILERQNNTKLLPQHRQRDYSGEEKIGDLFDRIEDTAMLERMPVAAKAAETRPAAAPAPRWGGDAPVVEPSSSAFTLAQTLHGKTGKPLYVATAERRMGSEDYKSVLAAAKKAGGYYSAFKGRGAVPGFQFPSETARAAFLADVAETGPKFQRRQTPADSAHEEAGQPDLFAGVEPLAERAQAGPFATAAADPHKAHFDQNHADLYRLASRIGTADQRLAEAKRLATEMGAFMDWSDDLDLSAAERARIGRGEEPTPAMMTRTAREYAKQFHDIGKTSFYDADRYHDVMQRWYEHGGGDRPQFQKGPIFYSAVERLADQTPTKAATADQWKATFRNAAGIKKEELDWIGLDDWLALFPAGEKVSKERVQAFIRDNGVKVEEKALGSDPGNRELEARVQERADALFDEVLSARVDEHMDRRPDDDEEAVREEWANGLDRDAYEEQARKEIIPDTEYSDWKLPGGEDYRELLFTLPKEANPPATHWDTPGVMAHVRFDTRTDPDGKKVLFVEEIQSDWHQKGRDQGYKKPASDEEREAARAAQDEADTRLAKIGDQVLDLAQRARAMPAASREMSLVQLRREAVAELNYRVSAGNTLGGRAEEWKALNREYQDARLAVEEARVRRDAVEGATGIPDAPFKASWPALVMKRMIRWAADNGFDKVAWTTGEQQGERYNLTKHVGRLTLSDNVSGGIGDARLDGPFDGGTLIVRDPSGQEVMRKTIYGFEGDAPRSAEIARRQLVDVVGKDLADRLIAAEPRHGRSAGLGLRERHVEGLDVKIGDEGMRAFYDRNLVNITNDIIKKYGAKVEKTKIASVGPEPPARIRELIESLEQSRDVLARAGNADEARKYEIEVGRQREKLRELEEGLDQHGFTITEKMAEAATGGFPLFQRAGDPSVGFAGLGAHLVADLYGVPPAMRDDAAKVIAEVDALIARIAPHAKSKPYAKLTDKSLESAQVLGATWRRAGRQLIAWSLESPDAIGTARHETIHALRQAGLFTTPEWNALERASLLGDWSEKYQITHHWGDLSWDDELEESIAERFRAWRRDDTARLPPLVLRAFRRLQALLDGIAAAWARAFGRTTANEVFGKIESGEVGARSIRPQEKVGAEDIAAFQREDPSRRDFLRGAASAVVAGPLRGREPPADIPKPVAPGNLDPWNRKILRNPDGGYSTTSSISIGTDRGEALIPTVVDGKRLSEKAAIAHFRETGENFGTFRTPDEADVYAQWLHEEQARVIEQAPVGPKFQKRRDAPGPVRPEDERKGPFAVVDRILGRGAEGVGRKLKTTADNFIPEPVAEIFDDVKMGLSPMGSGSIRAQAEAKDFANATRASQYQGAELDRWLERTFKPEQQKRMWEAADEHGVLLRRNVEPGPGQGLNRLTDAERETVEALQARAEAAYRQAKELGMVEGDGLESYVPRMVVQMTLTGGPQVRLKEPRRRDRNGVMTTRGRLSTTTGQLRHRKYETVEETEAAAKAAFGKGALVARNIRTLPLATQRLEQAIAGRVLVDKIKALSKDAQTNLVAEGGNPDPDLFFTMDHPALQKWQPRFIRDEATGKFRPLLDEKGDLVFESVPIWISKEFEGPMRAVLQKPYSGLVKALMDLKGKMMSVIMYSPLMHNAVIWGKAIPADPVGVLTFQTYFRGAAAKADPAIMKEAMAAGMAPIGQRFFNQDMSSMLEGAQIAPGRSWTSQIVGFIPGLFDPKAGAAVKRGVDRMGDVWHNTFLWDRVADLQAGLYVHMRDEMTKKANVYGITPQDAQKIAAHFANRYAGSLPMESMSAASRTLANLVLFSRSFTLGNLAAYKDVLMGLPSDVRAQVERAGGLARLEAVQGIARRKALSMLVMDVFLAGLGLVLAASVTAAILGEAPQMPWDNEEDRKNRFLIGYQPDGTAIYGRLPTGKVGEELVDWVTEPRDIALRKLSPYGRLLYALAANDKGFGRELFDENDDTPMSLVKNAGRIGWFVIQGVAPVNQIQGAMDIGSGAQDPKTAALQAFMPATGITVSKGAPGGPAMGEYYRAKEAYDFRVQEAMPSIRRQIKSGDISGARARMAELGIPPGLASYYIRTAENPRSRLGRRKMRDFQSFATDEQQERLDKAMAEERARRAAAGP